MTGPAPRFATGGFDADAYGAADGYPPGDRATFFDTGRLVGSFSHVDEIFRGRLVHKAAAPSHFSRVVEPRLAWTFEGTAQTVDDYLARTPTTGLLLAREETILVERYQYGRTDRDRLTSFSMAKTVTAMLVGIAIGEGRIRSIDDLAGAYVSELAATEYGRTSIRHLLQMSSGVRFSEDYEGHDDFATLRANTYRLQGAGGPDVLLPWNHRDVPPGTRFSYSSAETQMLGLVLARAVGRPVAEYLAEKLWQPIGAEADATWLIDNAGQEAVYGCLNAVLRDWARLGLLLAHDGHWRGRQLIPAAWVLEATAVRDDEPHLKPGVATPVLGYGYQTWIMPTKRRMFLLWGVRGQRIFVCPDFKLVMVNTSVQKMAHDFRALDEMAELWFAACRYAAATA
jgi:CubicO group peptidase (beta-lactamase class C family)